MPECLLATLGGQPQIVTLTLDLLLQRGERVDEVWTVFPGGNSRYREAHWRLYREFAEHPAYRGIRYRPRSVDDERGRPLEDLRTVEDMDRAWVVVQDLVRSLKGRGVRLHISLSGGRRGLALLLFAAATLYCTPNDRVWHIFTPPEVLAEVKDGAKLHVPPEAGVRLLEIPFAPWGAFFPGVKALLGLSPQQLQALRVQWPDEETVQRCAWVWRQLSPRQREVLRALVEQPTREAAAEALGVSVSTVDTHRQGILAVCREAWPEERVDLAFVRRVFGGWVRARPGEG